MSVVEHSEGGVVEALRLVQRQEGVHAAPSCSGEGFRCW